MPEVTCPPPVQLKSLLLAVPTCRKSRAGDQVLSDRGVVELVQTNRGHGGFLSRK